MRRPGIVALLACGFIGSAARAQAPRPADVDVEAAKALTKKGLSLYELGKYGEALQSLELAYEKKQVPALLFNIAQCHRQLGHLEPAARLYRAYLRTDPPEPGARQARELLGRVDDAIAKQATVQTAAPQELRPAVATTPVPDAALRPSPPPPREHRRWPALAAGGVAAGALTLGIASALGSRSATQQLQQLHASAAVDPARDAALRDEAASKNSRSKIFYAAAAAAAVAGAAFYIAF
jgi:tetratricopeptide (TPR) repeat protein